MQEGINNKGDSEPKKPRISKKAALVGGLLLAGVTAAGQRLPEKLTNGRESPVGMRYAPHTWIVRSDNPEYKKIEQYSKFLKEKKTDLPGIKVYEEEEGSMVIVYDPNIEGAKPDRKLAEILRTVSPYAYDGIPQVVRIKNAMEYGTGMVWAIDVYDESRDPFGHTRDNPNFNTRFERKNTAPTENINNEMNEFRRGRNQTIIGVHPDSDPVGFQELSAYVVSLEQRNEDFSGNKLIRSGNTISILFNTEEPDEQLWKIVGQQAYYDATVRARSVRGVVIYKVFSKEQTGINSEGVISHNPLSPKGKWVVEVYSDKEEKPDVIPPKH